MQGGVYFDNISKKIIYKTDDELVYFDSGDYGFTYITGTTFTSAMHIYDVIDMSDVWVTARKDASVFPNGQYMTTLDNTSINYDILGDLQYSENQYSTIIKKNDTIFIQNVKSGSTTWIITYSIDLTGGTLTKVDDYEYGYGYESLYTYNDSYVVFSYNLGETEWNANIFSVDSVGVITTGITYLIQSKAQVEANPIIQLDSTHYIANKVTQSPLTYELETFSLGATSATIISTSETFFPDHKQYSNMIKLNDNLIVASYTIYGTGYQGIDLYHYDNLYENLTITGDTFINYSGVSSDRFHKLDDTHFLLSSDRETSWTPGKYNASWRIFSVENNIINLVDSYYLTDGWSITTSIINDNDPDILYNFTKDIYSSSAIETIELKQ